MTEAFPKLVLDELARLTPLHRMGTAAETAPAVLFLASEEALFITWAVLAVDGGRSAVTPGVLGPAAHPDTELRDRMEVVR
jgi:3-oxoacyl-[acyl-carrier protein] reductase